MMNEAIDDSEHHARGSHPCVLRGAQGRRVTFNSVERSWASPPQQAPPMNYHIISGALTLTMEHTQWPRQRNA
jgi:hypothetical protein